MRKLVPFLLLGVIVSGGIPGANAQEEQRSVRIDTQTQRRGFEFLSPDGVLSVALRPQSAPATRVSLTRVYEGARAYEEMPPPITHSFASAIYSYDFPGVRPKDVKKPFGIKFHAPPAHAAIAYYDRGAHAWRTLLSSVLPDGSRVASLQFPFAHVALLSPRPFSGDTFLGSVRAAIVLDEQGRVLYVKEGDERLPIASLTKLMTALVFLEHNPGWATRVRIAASDASQPISLPARPGDVYVVKDLFYTMIVGSRNNAAKALARSTGISDAAFIDEMNTTAKSLGMSNTRFVDTTGLSPKNQSTVDDYRKLVAAAFSHADIRRAAGTREYIANRIVPRAAFSIRSTNKLLLDSHDFAIIAGKTGYIEEAGYNLAVQGVLQNHTITVLVFGAPSSDARFFAAQALLERTFASLGSGIASMAP